MGTPVVVLLANGFEEIEAITPVDILRRAGAEVFLAGVDGMLLTGKTGVTIQADCSLAEAARKSIDLLILPGGGAGAKTLMIHPEAQKLIQAVYRSGKPVGAICAAPMALHAAGVLKGAYTCYPGVESSIGGDFVEKSVITEGQITTSRGPGTAMAFSLELVGRLFGEAKRSVVEKEVVGS